MYRVMLIDRTQLPTVVSGEEAVAPPLEGEWRWIDLQRDNDTDLALLAERFRFHPLTIEDCAHFNQRPKYETYDGYLFIVMHGFEFDPRPDEALKAAELHTFLGNNYLITVHDEPLPSLDEVWNRLLSDPISARRGVDFIRYLIADAMVDALFPLVDQLANRVEEIEDALLGGAARTGTLEEILDLKRHFVALRKVLSPQRSVLAQLTRREDEFVSERTAFYFRDVHDHMLRIAESIEANRELLESVLAAYQWNVSQRTNEIVKRLTILSAVFLPLTFITGFFGQNFDALPFESKGLLAAMLVSCIAVPIGMLWLFTRGKWFK